jgi:hypothetical protein
MTVDSNQNSSRSLLLTILVFIAFPLFSLAFLQTLSQFVLWRSYYRFGSTFIPDCFLLTMRMSYVIGCIGLWRSKRWGFYLCILPWIIQFSSSLTFSFWTTGRIDEGHVASFIALVVFVTASIFVWPSLDRQKSIRTVAYYLPILFTVALSIGSVASFFPSASVIVSSLTQNMDEQETLPAADIERIKSVHQLAALVEEYRDIAGYYPFADRFNGKGIFVHIAEQPLVGGFMRPAASQQNTLVTTNEFKTALEEKLRRSINLPEDKRPVRWEEPFLPTFYRYFFDGRCYYITSFLRCSSPNTKELFHKFNKYEVASCENLPQKIRKFKSIGPNERIELSCP